MVLLGPLPFFKYHGVLQDCALGCVKADLFLKTLTANWPSSNYSTKVLWCRLSQEALVSHSSISQMTQDPALPQDKAGLTLKAPDLHYV